MCFVCFGVLVGVWCVWRGDVGSYFFYALPNFLDEPGLLPPVPRNLGGN